MKEACYGRETKCVIDKSKICEVQNTLNQDHTEHADTLGKANKHTNTLKNKNQYKKGNIETTTNQSFKLNNTLITNRTIVTVNKTKEKKKDYEQ